MNRFVLERRLWLIPVLLWAVLLSGSFAWNRGEVQRGAAELMLNEGRLIFKVIESARLWNAKHGGVYGLRDGSSPSNPYLQAEEKDLVTPRGRQLTLLNPAYMTRQLGEVIQDQTGIRIHITSLKPINPGNAANDWEARVLARFESGLDEYFEVVGRNAADAALVRYMAPLVTKQACLACHAPQGYKVGDIRGGISVVFSARPYLVVSDDRVAQLGWVHGLIWLLMSGLTLLGLEQLRKSLQSLQEAKARQDALVEQRTAELRREMEEHQQTESHFRMLLNASGEATFGIDAACRCTFCNPMAGHLLGYDDANQLIGKDMTALLQPVDPRMSAGLAAAALGKGVPMHVEEAEFCKSDGSRLAVEYRAHPIVAEGQVIGAVVTFSDITERKLAHERMWRQANYDALTNLPNRELLSDRLENAIAQARRNSGEVAVLFIDLDKFKQANDSLGHKAGDAILQQTARRMEACLREVDTVARLGGDEFLIVLPMIERHEDAELVARKIIEQINQPYQVGNGQAEISASIGIAYYPADGDNADQLLRFADRAMYSAKDAGRGTWRIYSNGA